VFNPVAPNVSFLPRVTNASGTEQKKAKAISQETLRDGSGEGGRNLLAPKKQMIGARTAHMSDAEHRQGAGRGSLLELGERVVEGATLIYE
jgi:hypothetical protein